MKIKDGFMIREVAGSYVVVPVGKRADEFNGMVHLNETGAFFWNIAEKGCTREELIKEGLDVYEVSRELITKDVDKFINILKSNDLFK